MKETQFESYAGKNFEQVEELFKATGRGKCVGQNHHDVKSHREVKIFRLDGAQFTWFKATEKNINICAQVT